MKDITQSLSLHNNRSLMVSKNLSLLESYSLDERYNIPK